MRYAMALAVFFLLGAGQADAAYGAGKSAKAELRDAQGKVVGTAKLSEVKDGVRIRLKVNGLPSGMHAFHIHNVGKCDPPEFTTAGPHFNPHGKKHGMKNPAGAHAGDLPNLEVSAKGTARVDVVAQGVTLGDGTNGLFHEGGAALVIHAKPDDEMTDPAGNAGPRIACGVVTK